MLARKWLSIPAAIIIFLLAINLVIVGLVRVYLYQREISYAEGNASPAASSPAADEGFDHVGKIAPFEEVDAFDDDAKHWSNIFSNYSAGVLIFDANGDGRPDVYFLQDGQNWTRPTDEKGVLMDKPRGKHSVLYLNQGNDEAGNPIFAQVGRLSQNSTYVKEELLVENFLFPRQSTSDSIDRDGRISVVAVAADLNNDELPDLIIGSGLPGMFFSHPETQQFLPEFVSPIGRESKKSNLPLTAQGMHLIQYEPRENREDMYESARGREYMGANTLLLNLGDRDGDGIPEWRDASRQAGIEGQRNTTSISVADIDLDGDLDFYVGNSMDPDYWPGGSRKWAGGVNELYINQLAETGQFRFVERAGQMDVDGVYDERNPMPAYHRLMEIPFLPVEYSFLFMKFVKYQPEYLKIGDYETERGQISWVTALQDANDDGYPDIWVGNDLGYLRLYINEEGKCFHLGDHARRDTSGNWMSLSFADFNGDLKEDFFAGNLGGAVMSISFSIPDPHALFDPVIGDAAVVQHFVGTQHNAYHAIIDGADVRREFDIKVQHSRLLPPDASLPGNIREVSPVGEVTQPLKRDSLDPYEFSWGSASFDVQNDGLMDFYYVGCLYGRGGGLFPVAGVGPGRLLVNVTEKPEQLRLVDLTGEYNVFNIHELQYDKLGSEGYIYRKSPLQNWGKRDMVYSYDRSSWALNGPLIQEKVVNHDMIQTSENGRAVIAADLNLDGFSDLLVRNVGGYDSRSSKATNLYVKIDGKVRVLPAHSYHYPSMTNYEPGTSRLFMNSHRENNWIRVRLIDDSPATFNRDAIGARIVVNDKLMSVKRAGEGGLVANKLEDPLIGLGKAEATSIEVTWPDRQRTRTRLDLPNLSNGTLTISKAEGDWEFRPRYSKSQADSVSR